MIVPNPIIPSDPMRNAVTKMSETDVARLLKETLFALIRADASVDAEYGGVRVAPGRYARIKFEIYDKDATPAPEPQPEVAADLIERLRTAIDLGTKMGARGKHPSNIYNIAAEALAVLSAPSVVDEAVKAEPVSKRALDLALSLFVDWQGPTATDIANAILSFARTSFVEDDAVKAALLNIRDLNMSGADENGHRWANSDLIEQEIVSALNTIRARSATP